MVRLTVPRSPGRPPGPGRVGLGRGRVRRCRVLSGRVRAGRAVPPGACGRVLCVPVCRGRRCRRLGAGWLAAWAAGVGGLQDEGAGGLAGEQVEVGAGAQGVQGAGGPGGLEGLGQGGQVLVGGQHAGGGQVAAGQRRGAGGLGVHLTRASCSAFSFRSRAASGRRTGPRGGPGPAAARWSARAPSR